MSDLPESTALIIPGEVSAVGLVLPEGLSFENWEAVVKQVGLATRAYLWWIGDALNYGERKWGEMYAQALDYEWATISNAKYVASRIDLSRRREKLSFNHHAEVAALDNEIADSLLDEAIHEHWNRDELRRAVRRHKTAALPPPEIPHGSYSVLLADPPWRYDFSPTESRQIENQYPTMAVEDICDLAATLPLADACRWPS